MATLWNMGGLTWRDLARRVWSELSEDSILGWSAQLSFYFLLSIFPTLFFLLVLFGYFVGQGTQIRVALIGYLGALAPESTTQLVDKIMNVLSENLRRIVPVSPGIATIIVIVSLVGLTVAGIWLLSRRVAQQAAALYEELPRSFVAIADRFQHSEIGNQLTKFVPRLQDVVHQAGGVIAPASWVFSSSIGLIVNLVVILFVGLYLALDPQRYIHGLLLLVPSNQRGQAKDLLYSIAATLRRWTLGRMLLMLANAILTSTGLWLLDVPFALTLGLIAGLLNFVPNLGQFIASIPAILVGLLESPTQAIYVAILYLALQAVDGYIFTPLVQQQTGQRPTGYDNCRAATYGCSIRRLGPLVGHTSPSGLNC